MRCEGMDLLCKTAGVVVAEGGHVGQHLGFPVPVFGYFRVPNQLTNCENLSNSRCQVAQRTFLLLPNHLGYFVTKQSLLSLGLSSRRTLSRMAHSRTFGAFSLAQVARKLD
jgi:hypothetical protein